MIGSEQTEVVWDLREESSQLCLEVGRPRSRFPWDSPGPCPLLNIVIKGTSFALKNLPVWTINNKLYDSPTLRSHGRLLRGGIRMILKSYTGVLRVLFTFPKILGDLH